MVQGMTCAGNLLLYIKQALKRCQTVVNCSKRCQDYGCVCLLCMLLSSLALAALALLNGM